MQYVPTRVNKNQLSILAPGCDGALPLEIQIGQEFANSYISVISQYLHKFCQACSC